MAAPGDYLTVPTTFGSVVSRANQVGLYQFLGIPYATAGRWEPPRPLQISATPIDATRFGDSCPQTCRQPPFCPDRISESCHYLNIYTPFTDQGSFQTPTATTNATTPGQAAAAPVVVFIHGGSFETGSGSISALNATDLSVSLNAVVVTFNYRLGVFGFFDVNGAVGETPQASPSPSPVNFGILDQRMALQWVVANIAAFGGDKDKVKGVATSTLPSAAT
ncbi:hypothetical protein HK104_005708 [Borealophlyctis nickersoniae]|nr:hypothetical protein HK104_005708 [Borealophlyctis nickersoniae]